jgi:hypothetical protein
MKLTAIACVISIALTFALTSQYKTAIFNAKIADLKADASKTLASETEKVLIAERKAATLNQQLELSHHEANTKIDQLNRSLKSSRLRDPFGSGCSSNSAKAEGSSASNPNGEAASGELSAEFVEFLTSEAYRADQISNYADTCHAYIQRLNNE